MRSKKIVTFVLAMIIGLNSSIYMLPNTVYATEISEDISTKEKLGLETEKKEDNFIEESDTRQDLLDNIKVENIMEEKSNANGKEVSKLTKDILLGVNYYTDKIIADLLSPNRFSATDKLNKKLEISKRDNIPIVNVTDEQVEKELKAENVHVMSYGEVFSKIQKNIESIIQKLVENSKIEKGYTGDHNQYFIDKIINNKEKLLLGISYIHRLYDFNIGSENIKEILLYTPNYYGKQVDPLDWLIRIGGAGGEILKVSNNTKAYMSLFKGVITDEESLLSFLKENRDRFEPNTEIDEWFRKTSKAIIVEKPSQINTNAKTSLYSKLSSETKLQSHILPLLTLSDNSIYVICNSTTITYGLVDTYVDRNLKENNSALYQEKIEQFKEQVERGAIQQNDFIGVLSRLGKPNVQPLLSTNRLVIDSLRIYNSGTVNPAKEWSPKFGDAAAIGVKEFITPLNLYAQYFVADGQAEGEQIRLFLAKALDERGLSAYTHELTHLLVGTVFLNNNGQRDGLEAEFYPRGLFESYELNDPILNLNLIYDHKGKERFHNASPERFGTENDLQQYMKGLFDVIYTLDYAEANVLLKKDNNDKQKWFHKLEQKNDTRNRYNQGNPNATHKIDSVRKISIEEANELNTIYDLIEKNIIASRYEVEGLKTTGDVPSNGYYVIPLFSSNYASVQNNNGVSGDVMMRRQAHELLAEYGYYNGMVPYISNQYKDDAEKDSVILSDEYILGKIFDGKYKTMTDFKKEMFKERINKKDQLKPISIMWNNRKVTIDSFDKINELMTEAVESDLKNVQELPSGWNNIRAQNTQVEILKKEIFKAYLNDTDDFNNSIYQEANPVKKYTVTFEKNANDATGEMEDQVFEYGIEQELTGNKFKREGYYFDGWKDEKGNVYEDKEVVNNIVDIDNGEIVFYAKWKPIQYQVKFNKNNPSAIGIMENQEILYDEEQQLNKNKFELKGYTFKGWARTPNGEVQYKDQDRVSKLTTNPNDPIELYAVWIKNQEVINSVPTINAIDKVLTVGDKFNPLDGVTAYDAEDGEIKVTDADIISNNVDIRKAGTYHITYKVTDSKGASVEKRITVIVKEKQTTETVSVISVSLNKITESLLKGNTTTLVATIKPSNATNKLVTWSSSNNSVATVDQNGKVTAVSKGIAIITVTSKDGSKKATCTITVTEPVNHTGIQGERIYGSDRYETSYKLFEKGWNTSDTVILAYGLDYPDALSAAPLAGKKNAPILLVKNSGLKSQQRLKELLINKSVKNAIIVGGTGVISSEVDKDLTSMGIYVKRLGGRDRYETSALIAKEVGINTGEVALVNGLSFADALSISSIATKKNMPILLTKTEVIPESIKKYLESNINFISKTYVVGATGVVSNSILNKLKNPERLGGVNRFETNKKVLDRFKKEIDLSSIYIASGLSFPDALAASALAGKNNNFVLLSHTTRIEDVVKIEISENKSNINKAYILGSKAIISDEIIRGLGVTSIK